MQRTASIVALLALAGSVGEGDAQEIRRAQPGVVIASSFGGGSHARLGLSVASGSERDTLGLLVTAITPDGPAEQAGLIEGDRLQAVNGVPLTLSRADAGEPDMSMILRRRLERELGKVETGDEVTLRVWSAGRTREVKVRAAEDTRHTAHTNVFSITGPREMSSRAVIGVSLAATGSARDTLGVFVTAVAPGGPAERAGIIEGQRIAAIGDVDLRVPAADAGDAMVASTKSSRLAREIESMEPGQRVRLRVWSEGRYRDVTVEIGRYGDVYKDRHGAMSFSGNLGAGLMAPSVILRSMPDGPGAARESLDSLWLRRETLRRSVDPRYGADSTDSTLRLRIDELLRGQIEQSLQGLRRMQLMPSPIITTSIRM